MKRLITLCATASLFTALSGTAHATLATPELIPAVDSVGIDIKTMAGTLSVADLANLGANRSLSVRPAKTAAPGAGWLRRRSTSHQVSGNSGSIDLHPGSGSIDLHPQFISTLNPASQGFFFDNSDNPTAVISVSSISSPQTISYQSLTPGSVATPIPPALFLMGSGLAGLLGYRKRSRTAQ